MTDLKAMPSEIACYWLFEVQIIVDWIVHHYKVGRKNVTVHRVTLEFVQASPIGQPSEKSLKLQFFMAMQVLSYWDPLRSGGGYNPFSDAVKAHPLANTRLVSALIHFYVDVESTGASSEFYDKFSIRFNISVIFISLWKEGFLKPLFAREAK